MKLSPSKINTYLNCPLKFYYYYIKKIKTKPSIHLLRGTIVHKVLEDLFDGRPPKSLEGFKKKARTLFDNRWNVKSLKMDADEEETFRLESLNMIENYAANVYSKMDSLMKCGKKLNVYQAYNTIKPKVKEVRLSDDDLDIRGIVDQVFVDYNGNTIIVDLKTSNSYRYSISEDYFIQLCIYALLYKRLNGVVADWVCVDYLKAGEKFFFKCGVEETEFAEKVIKEVHSKVVSSNKDDYPKCPNSLCAYCDFKDVCHSSEESMKVSVKMNKGKEDSIVKRLYSGRSSVLQ